MRKYFTLLEMMVCLLILSLFAVPVIGSGKGLWDDYAYKVAVERVHQTLLEGRSLAMSYQSCFLMDIQAKGNQIVVTLKSEEPAERGRGVSFAIPGCTHFLFHQQKTSSLMVHILPSGRIEPLGSLTFTRSKRGSTLYIDWATPFLIRKGEKAI